MKASSINYITNYGIKTTRRINGALDKSLFHMIYHGGDYKDGMLSTREYIFLIMVIANLYRQTTEQFTYHLMSRENGHTDEKYSL